MHELEHMVVKTIFSVKKAMEIEQIDMTNRDLEMHDVSLQENTSIKRKAPKVQYAENPLMNNPNSDSSGKVKIRV
jgi:hypothetical protein